MKTSDVILRGSRSTLDVSCCVFSANCIASAAGSGDKVQIFVAGVAFCERRLKLTEAWHETSILRSVPIKKNRRKTSILRLRSEFEEAWHEMFVLMLQHVSSRVAGFCGAVAVSMGEAAKPFLVEGFKTGCHVVLRGRRGTS